MMPSAIVSRLLGFPGKRPSSASKAPFISITRPRTRRISRSRTLRGRYPFSYAPEELPDLLASIERRYPDPDRELERWARKFLRSGHPTGTGELLKTLTYGIKESFAYARRSEGGTHPPLTTLRLGRGSCRDLALLMIEALRCLGLAARFVSGYIYVPDRDGPERLGGGSTHAWCQVYLARRRVDRDRPDERDHRQPRSHSRRGGARSCSGKTPHGHFFRRRER